MDERRRVEGRVHWWDRQKGLGFAFLPDGRQAFLHYRNVLLPGRRDLWAGQRVLFDVTDTPKGLLAENVSPLERGG